MEYKDWVILKTISAERNLTKAAERLFISQPALSYRLQNLEKDLGVKILNRHSTGVDFTPQGEYLLQYSEEMLTKLEYVKEFVRNMDSSVQGSLRLGVSSVIAKFKMASLLKSYKNQCPAVEIILNTGSSTLQLPDMLQKNQIDIALIRGDVPWLGPKHYIAEEPMCIVYSQPIDTEKLSLIPWIRYDASTITKTEQQQCAWWQEQFACPPPNIIKVDSVEACLQLVSHGFGWCIAPKIHISNRRSLYSCPVVWRDGHVMLRKTIMIYNHGVLDKPAGKTFIDHMLRNYT